MPLFSSPIIDSLTACSWISFRISQAFALWSSSHFKWQFSFSLEALRTLVFPLWSIMMYLVMLSSSTLGTLEPFQTKPYVLEKCNYLIDNCFTTVFPASFFWNSYYSDVGPPLLTFHFLFFSLLFFHLLFCSIMLFGRFLQLYLSILLNFLSCLASCISISKFLRFSKCSFPF